MGTGKVKLVVRALSSLLTIDPQGVRAMYAFIRYVLTGNQQRSEVGSCRCTEGGCSLLVDLLEACVEVNSLKMG